MVDPRRILVVDDEPFSRQALRRMLEGDGWSVAEASTQEEARLAVASDPEPSVVVLDSVMKDGRGLDFIDVYRSGGGVAPVLVTARTDDAETAVRAMKAGAYDFVVKPVERERFLRAVVKAVETGELVRENRSLRRRVREEAAARTLVGEGAAMQALRAEMDRIVESDISVCIVGETGTGKELVARWLHEHGPRSRGPFVDMNCAAVPETLIESELFGHERGAFTGAVARQKGKLELADGGSLLLDELGEMSLALQARLLRVLQERTLHRIGGGESIPFDVRVVSATQRDLFDAVQKGHFREDLYFRVVVYPLRVPPLRDRREDLPLLVAHFLRKFRGRTAQLVDGITPEALVRLEAHDWPGNVRELENAIHRAMVSARGPFLTTADFPDVAPLAVPRLGPRPWPAEPSAPPLPAPPPVSAPRPALALVTLEDHERAAIQDALGVTHGNVKAAADRLKVARSTLYRRMRALRIPAAG